MRLRKYEMTFLIFCLSFLGCGQAAAADIAKIGVVDLQRTLETCEPGKSAQAEIKKNMDSMGEDLKIKGAEIEQLRMQLEREAMVMSKEKREEKEREFRIKLNDLKSLEKRYRSDMQNLNQKLITGLRDEVLTLVEEIGKKEGYLLIIDNRTVMYAPASIDITDQIIKLMNEKYAKKSGN